MALLLLFGLCTMVCSQKIEKSPANYYDPTCPLIDSLRKPSLPFITGDTFRFFADHVYDEVCSFDPANVKKGDIIFVSGWFLRAFFAIKHPNIRFEYILISGNSDIEIDDYFLPYLQDDKLRYFFATNVIIKHSKAMGLPIGLSNLYYKHGNLDALNRVAKKGIAAEKNHLLNVSFATYTNPNVRISIYDFFAAKKYCKTFVSRDGSNMQDYETYLRNLSACCFAISPFGNGPDCHRVWEACWVGCIPIVQSSPLNDVYSDLPILIVDDFLKITEDFLQNKFFEIRSNIENKKYNMEKLYFNYWLRKIREAQALIRK